MEKIFVYKKYGGLFSSSTTIGTIVVKSGGFSTIALDVYRGYENFSLFNNNYVGTVHYYEKYDQWEVTIPHNGFFVTSKTFDITKKSVPYVVHSYSWIEGVSGVTTSHWNALDDHDYIHRKTFQFALGLLFGDLLK